LVVGVVLAEEEADLGVDDARGEDDVINRQVTSQKVARFLEISLCADQVDEQQATAHRHRQADDEVRRLEPTGQSAVKHI